MDSLRLAAIRLKEPAADDSMRHETTGVVDEVRDFVPPSSNKLGRVQRHALVAEESVVEDREAFELLPG